MKKMRIAMVGTKGIPAKWGGIEKYIEEIGKRLVERGHEVTVFGSRWFLRDFREKTYLGMRICRLPTVHFQATDALSNAFLATVMVAIGNYDIVNFHGYASYLFVPVLRNIGKIIVVTAHGVESGWDNPKYDSLAQNVIRRSFEIGVKKANIVVTVADHLKIRIKHSFGVDAEVLPSGLDEVTRHPLQSIRDKYGLKSEGYLLFLGRIDPIKRIEWLLDLINVLGDNIKLVIAGGAQDPSTKAYLKSLKDKAEGKPQIIFTGPVSGREKAELLGNCLLFLAPSKDEGLPITVLEAATYKRCCIASDIPAHQETIDNGTTGFLFPRDDKKSFVEKVKNLLNKPHSFINSIGNASKHKVTDKFNWERTVDKTEILYRKLLDERRKSTYE